MVKGSPYAGGRLLNQLKPTQATQVWASDSTHLPLASGKWACRCAYQDMASIRVVGGQVLATMPEGLSTTALQRALWAPPPAPSLLVYSGRGERPPIYYCKHERLPASIGYQTPYYTQQQLLPLSALNCPAQLGHLPFLAHQHSATSRINSLDFKHICWLKGGY